MIPEMKQITLAIIHAPVLVQNQALVPAQNHALVPAQNHVLVPAQNHVLVHAQNLNQAQYLALAHDQNRVLDLVRHIINTLQKWWFQDFDYMLHSGVEK